MIILEKPYVSEFMADSIIKNDWAVLDNDIVEHVDTEGEAFKKITPEEAIEQYQKEEYPIIYSNSENSISWVLENLPDSNISKYIKIFKDKLEFRNMLKEMFPNFSYRCCNFDELKVLNESELKFPFVVKPSVGFLSYGVHSVYNYDDFKNVVNLIQQEMQEAKKLYPQSVVSDLTFIIEDLIEGDEFAIDSYYDKDGSPVILNIFQHPFLDKTDVRDRIYIMSVDIMHKYKDKFLELLKCIGKRNNIRNFPMHMEVRVTPKGTVIPIEVNPMRFAGWCTTDVAQYVWDINTYEYFMEQIKPDWNYILKNTEKGIYYFSMAEVPSDIDREQIKSFNYRKYLSNFSDVFEFRGINHKENPLFAIIFGQASSHKEIENILKLQTKDYIELY